MSALASIEAALIIAERIVATIVQVAPGITQGAVSASPYVQGLAELLKGTNITQEQLDAVMARLHVQSDEFNKPLPPDDGTTTT